MSFDQTASPEPHKDRVQWRAAIAKGLLVEVPVPIKDLTLYELEDSIGALQVWKNESLKNIAFFEVSAKQIMSEAPPASALANFFKND